MTRFRKNVLVAVAVCVFGSIGISTSCQILGTRAAVQARDRIAADQAAKNDPVEKPNLSLWIPDEELGVWDPVNTNVNPVPWRVYAPSNADPNGSAEFRHLAVGKRVRVEGLAWGYDVNTLMPKSRVVFDGGTVLVKGVDFHKPEVRGRVVRVVGTLLLESMSQPGVSRQLPKYYCLAAESFEVIEQSTEPHVVALPRQQE